MSRTVIAVGLLALGLCVLPAGCKKVDKEGKGAKPRAPSVVVRPAAPLPEPSTAPAPELATPEPLPLPDLARQQAIDAAKTAGIIGALNSTAFKDLTTGTDIFGGADFKSGIGDLNLRGGLTGDSFGEATGGFGLGSAGRGVGGGGTGWGTIGAGRYGTIGQGSGTGSGYGSGGGGGRGTGGIGSIKTGKTGKTGAAKKPAKTAPPAAAPASGASRLPPVVD